MTNNGTPLHPLAEVFGFPISNMSQEAQRTRKNRLCPFHNSAPNCTKNSRENPLGVCTVYEGTQTVITCPIRFREDWIVTVDAAEFFFPEGARWTSFTEVRLEDVNGQSAGNIDVVLVSYDLNGKLLDFGALEIQAVYISGNVTDPFEAYMNHPSPEFTWTRTYKYPRPDYLSSSRKRLAPQLIYKGGILSSWGKKIAVAIDEAFFTTLPPLPEVPPQEAELAWFIYGLRRNQEEDRFTLQRQRIIYTKFETSLARVTVSKPGPIGDFVNKLQDKLSDKLKETDDTPPPSSFGDRNSL